MGDVIAFATRDERLGRAMGELDMTLADQAAIIAASPDAAILEVHDTLAREIRSGAISVKYSLVLNALAAEIAKRGLNVVHLPPANPLPGRAT